RSRGSVASPIVPPAGDGSARTRGTRRSLRSRSRRGSRGRSRTQACGPARGATRAVRRRPSEAFDRRPRHRDHSRAVTRLFTPDEANLALEHVRPVAEEMVRHSRELAQAQIRQAELVARIAGNGGDITPGEVRDAAEEVARAADAVAACGLRLGDAGVPV